MHLSTFTLFLLIMFICSAVLVDSFTYLSVLHFPAFSHFWFGASLMKALAQKGHEVYVISPFSQEQPIENYHDVTFKVPTSEIKKGENDFKNLVNNENILETGIDYFKTGYYLSKVVLDDPKVQHLMASNITFDAVICEGHLAEPLFGLSEHFKAPLIVLNSFGATTLNTDLVGSPSPPSYVPHILLTFTDHMTFIERLVNMVVVIGERILIDFYYLPMQADLYNQYFSHLERDLYTLRKNAAAVLLNSHGSFSVPRPYMPNHIEVGGMHINRQRKPLPEDIEKFIKEAKHGVVYFSLGSIRKSAELSAKHLKQLTTAFESLKQRVLWKFEDSLLENKPDSVYISNWFPQGDVLAHENVKVFITHGGLLSTIESIYHGTPIIGIPIEGDQFYNIERAEAGGYGISLDLQKLNAKDIVAAVERVLNDESFTQRIKDISALYRDQPIPPMDLATFWVEHIARHKGAKYLHCAGLDLSFIEYHNMDVLLVLFGIILLVLYAILYFFNKLIKAGLKKFTFLEPTKKDWKKINSKIV